MATTQFANSEPPLNDLSSSQSSSGILSGGKIAAIVIGTILAVSFVCLLLFYPQLIFVWLTKSRSQNRTPGSEEAPLKDLPPQRPGRASGNDGSSSGADDAGSRRRRPDVLRCGSTQAHGNHIVTNRRSGGPVVINNNIHVNSNDYLLPLPVLNSPRKQNPAPPAAGIPRNAQRASGTRDIPSSPQPNSGKPPRRTTPGEPTAPRPRPLTATQTEASSFSDVADWARKVETGRTPRSPVRERASSPLSRIKRTEMRRAEGSYRREGALRVPGAFPQDGEDVEGFQLVTAPTRVFAPGTPTHGDSGFWVRGAREGRWRREEKEDRREWNILE